MINKMALWYQTCVRIISTQIVLVLQLKVVCKGCFIFIVTFCIMEMTITCFTNQAFVCNCYNFYGIKWKRSSSIGLYKGQKMLWTLVSYLNCTENIKMSHFSIAVHMHLWSLCNHILYCSFQYILASSR